MNKKFLTERERFRQLYEYSFYESDKDSEELLFDDLNEDDSLEQGDELPIDNSEPAEMEDDSATANPEGGEDDGNVDLSSDIPDEPAEELPPSEPLQGDQPEEDSNLGGDEIELDVTELVDSTKEAKNSADLANEKIAQLVMKFDNLQKSIEAMAGITTKINDLEREVVNRNPTPVEKLEMRSMDSYPYNLKLTDFWGSNPDKEPYVVRNEKGQPTSNEYVLTQDDVNSDYNENDIKKSFDNNYEEEDIDDEIF